MKLIILLEDLADAQSYQVGLKAFSLGVVFRRGIQVPRCLCVTQDAYDMYVRTTGLMERISIELCRKDLKDMQWEELWDVSLRIRSMFLNTAIPSPLIKKIRGPIEEVFADRPVVVRSSAPGEDSGKASFAGIHESFINVRGIYSILDHIRLVWASLWSDAALLYRKELELDVHHSTMAVIIQELIDGQRSGVVFSRAPSDEGRVLIEAIHGLNQGYLEGMVEPDRWFFDRSTGKMVAHEAARRLKIVSTSASGVSLKDLAPGLCQAPPLSDEEAAGVYSLLMGIEGIFGSPQHVEWTFDGEELYTLQVSPIPEPSLKASGDIHNWHYSLERSFSNLKALKERIEDELIPEMVKEATSISERDIAGLSDTELSGVIHDMSTTFQAWERAYWKYFMPFAHGMRLFGRVYNDAVRPHDPYEFMDLLRSSGLLSIERNTQLERLAAMVRQSPALAAALREARDTSVFPGFHALMKAFIRAFGDLSCYGSSPVREGDVVRDLVIKLAFKPVQVMQPGAPSVEDFEEDYLSFFPDDRRHFAGELLNLARAGYRLRDDENIYLGRLKGHLRNALYEGRKRLEGRLPHIGDADIPRALKDPGYNPPGPSKQPDEVTEARFAVHMRQLIGLPAGYGIATGPARVLLKEQDLADFQAGEIIVCDALDPDMTFIMPLAAGIVERSGGMLIHGAVMAREYALPCVIGVTGAVSLIRTGDMITVDGYLGIVVIGEK